MRILRQVDPVRPEGDGWVGECACERGVVGGSRPDGPRTGSAGSLTASGNWTAGGVRNVGDRRPSASASTGRSPGHGRSTPRRNASGVRRPDRGGAGRQPRPRRARGHAVRGCRKFSVTGRAATTRRVPAPTHTTAGRRALPPCVRRRTVNVSACGATASRANSNASRSTQRPASNAARSLRPGTVLLRPSRWPSPRWMRSSFWNGTPIRR